MDKLSIDQLKLGGRRVLVRVDFNVPLTEDGKVRDDMRIRAALPTINKILNEDGKAVLMSHLGRPKGERKPEFSLKPVAEHLSKLIGQQVQFAVDCVGPDVEAQVGQLSSGECLLLENLRFHAGETTNEAGFAEALSRLGDVYVNDAFGTAHRAHASTAGVTRYFDQRAAGYLIVKELDYLGKALENPRRPFIAILGGAKISGKIEVIKNLLPQVDALIIGGGIVLSILGARMALPAEQGGFGLEATLIGTIFLAISTSLPELVISIASVRMGFLDMAVGNVLGSNMFNLLIIFAADVAMRGDNLLRHASSRHWASVGQIFLLTLLASVLLRSRNRMAATATATAMLAIYIAALAFLV